MAAKSRAHIRSELIDEDDEDSSSSSDPGSDTSIESEVLDVEDELGDAANGYDKHMVDNMRGARATARASVRVGARRMYTVMEEQRMSFVQRTPNHPLAGAAEEVKAAAFQAFGVPHAEEKTKRVEEAFAALELQARRIVSAVASVRIAELALRPFLRTKPAALAFAVSAPCTSWSVDVWPNNCGLPRIVALLRLAILASFSGPKNRAGSKNGMGRCPLVQRRGAKLCGKRNRVRNRIAKALSGLVAELEKFRLRFVKTQAHHPLAFPEIELETETGSELVTENGAESEVDDEADIEEREQREQQEQQAREAIEAAYLVLDNITPNFINALAVARNAQLAIDPVARFRPAVVAFSVDAPGTCWNPGVWHNCALPRVVPLLQQVFLAAFSSQVQSENQAFNPGRTGDKKKGTGLAPATTGIPKVIAGATQVVVGPKRSLRILEDDAAEASSNAPSHKKR